MAKNDEKDGVWRTIGGRRVFIKKGQSLASAMKESGKFKGSKEKIKPYSKEDYEDRDRKLQKRVDEGLISKAEMEYEKAKQAWQRDEISRGEFEKVKRKLSEEERDRIREKEIEELNEKASKEKENENKEKSKKIYIGGYEATKEDIERLKSIEEEALEYQRQKYGEETYKKLKREVDKDEDDTFKKATNDDWRTQIKSNKDKLEKELQDFKEKNKNNMTDEKTQKEYYELFRKNERENAKLKREEPNEKYEFVEAYAGYKDKFKDTWGEDGSGEKVASAKMYTNDEFMEHLEDANWHSERRQLLEANLTNKELEYIKNRTNVSAWGVENLNGKEQVDALIKEAKENANKDKGLNLSQRQIDEGNRLAQKSENGVREDLKTHFGLPSSREYFKGKEEDLITGLSNEWGIDRNRVKELYKEEDIKHRYDGTIKNLQQATNLSMEEILEIVKEIEKKNKK